MRSSERCGSLGQIRFGDTSGANTTYWTRGNFPRHKNYRLLLLLLIVKMMITMTLVMMMLSTMMMMMMMMMMMIMTMTMNIYDFRDVDWIRMWHARGNHNRMHHTLDYRLGKPSTTCTLKPALSANITRQSYLYMHIWLIQNFFVGTEINQIHSQ